MRQALAGDKSAQMTNSNMALTEADKCRPCFHGLASHGGLTTNHTKPTRGWHSKCNQVLTTEVFSNRTPEHCTAIAEA
jgi:hypothetical protein